MIGGVEGQRLALVAERVVIVVAGDQQPGGLALHAAVAPLQVAALDLVAGEKGLFRAPQSIPAIAAGIQPIAADHAVPRLDQHQRHARADHFAIAELHVGAGQQHGARADLFQPPRVVLLQAMGVAEMMQPQAAEMGIVAQLAGRNVAPGHVVRPLVIGTDHQPPRGLGDDRQVFDGEIAVARQHRIDLRQILGNDQPHQLPLLATEHGFGGNQQLGGDFVAAPRNIDHAAARRVGLGQGRLERRRCRRPRRRRSRANARTSNCRAGQGVLWATVTVSGRPKPNGPPCPLWTHSWYWPGAISAGSAKRH